MNTSIAGIQQRHLQAQIRGNGSTVTLADGTKIQAYPVISKDQIAKTVSSDELKRAEGKIIVFYVQAADALKVKAMRSGALITFQGETYVVQPVKSQPLLDNNIYGTFLASTGGYWRFTDAVAIFSDHSSRDTMLIDPVTKRPIVADAGTTAWTGNVVATDTGISPSETATASPNLVSTHSFAAKFIYTGNVDDPTAVGRLKRFSLDVADYMYLYASDMFDPGTGEWNIANGDYVLNVGTEMLNNLVVPTPNWGQVSIVLGSPRVFAAPDSNDSNLVELRVMQAELPPASIAAFIASLKASGYVMPTH